MYSKSQLLNFFNRKKTPLVDNYLFLTYVCRLVNRKEAGWFGCQKYPKQLISRTCTSFFIVLCHFVYLILASPATAFSQTTLPQHEVINSLRNAGFENIFVKTKPDTLTVYLENRRFRFDPRGLAEAVVIIQNNVADAAGKLQLVITVTV